MDATRPVGEEILDRFDSLMRHAAESHTPEFLDTDVTISQAKVLYLVSLEPGLAMSAIAARLGVGASAISGLVDRLAAGGHVERREDPADRRYWLIRATDSGLAELDRLRELNSQVLRRLVAGLDDRECEALLISLEALDREVQRLDQASHPTTDHPERTPA